MPADTLTPPPPAELAEWERLCEAMIPYRHAVRVIHGAARGADTLAHEWAAHHEIPVDVYPADWQAHGRAAGPIRNARMLEEGKPDVVVAFKGGRGTADMVRRARASGVPVVEVG